MFQRVGAAAYKADLNNTIALCAALENPERKFLCVHIAGTNGKGSVSHMLAAVLQEAGYKTGLFTSPHLKDFRERIRINGKMISKPKVVRFVQKHKRTFEKIKPSFFEWTAALAFDHFANEQVDIAILETGMGGRLDSTNVVNPLISIITNIGYDHQQFLGNTLKKIAAEKAGIIKSEGTVIISEYQPEVSSVFEKKAEAMNASLVYTRDFKSQLKISKCGLAGSYQKKNIPTVVLAAGLLNEVGFQISPSDVKRGIENVVKLTGIRGRWEILQKKPLVVADIAHNASGIKEVLKQVKNTGYKDLRIVLGVVSDKEISHVLKLLPKKATYYFCNAKIPRALPSDILLETGRKYRLKGKAYESVKNALNQAKKESTNKDLILITGSAFVVAEAI